MRQAVRQRLQSGNQVPLPRFWEQWIVFTQFCLSETGMLHAQCAREELRKAREQHQEQLQAQEELARRENALQLTDFDRHLGEVHSSVRLGRSL